MMMRATKCCPKCDASQIPPVLGARKCWDDNCECHKRLGAAECHCGKDGHPLGSINCPVHGSKALASALQAAVLALEEVQSSLRTLGEDGWSDAPHLLRVVGDALREGRKSCRSP